MWQIQQIGETAASSTTSLGEAASSLRHMDPTLERLYVHMAWANQEILKHLRALPESALSITQVQSQWSVGEMITHIIGASRSYLARLEGKDRPAPLEPAKTHADLDALVTLIADVDAGLLVQAANGEGVVTFMYEGEQISRKRVTILAQVIHHATEHRAHIADALAAAGQDVVDLDEMDLWSYGEKVAGGA